MVSHNGTENKYTEIEYARYGLCVVTAAECPVEKRAMAVEKMSGFSNDLKFQAGTIHTRFGILMTGSNPGSLIFVRSYESLSGFEKAQEVYANSAPYNDLIKQSGVKILLTEILQSSCRWNSLKRWTVIQNTLS